MKFRTILADPPWSFGGGYGSGAAVLPRRNRNNGKGGSIHPPDAHYSCMTHAALCALPVSAVASKDSALLMWSTWAHLEEAIDLINAWGFKYKTAIPWVKMQRDAAPRRGFGFHVANCSEPLLIASRGTANAPGPSQIGIMFHPAGPHSAKPDDQYMLAERYPAPYLEMFARPEPAGLFPPREGWTYIGAGATGRDIADDLRLLAETEK